MNIAILQTARAGSESVPNKNILSFNGIPLFLHNILHAKKSKYKPPVYLSTDILDIDHLAVEHEFTIIKRPENLSGSSASHHDVMRHGIKKIEEIQNTTLDIIVVILGNTISSWTEDIDKAIDLLHTKNNVDSVISVGKYNMFNPIRSLLISDKGDLERAVNCDLSHSVISTNTNDKDVIGDVYYLNGSLMVMRRSAVFSYSDKLPFSWLGDKTVPIIQDSVCMEIDAKWQTCIIKNISEDYPVEK
jgi:CMP-N-acetylneuraminic acid synthetase